MHKSSMYNMKNFRIEYLYGRRDLKVLDVGSRDLNGSYKILFGDHDYIGFDMVLGENVDVSDWSELKEDSFDVVISGQAFEHIEDDQAVMNEIARVLKQDSYCCIIAPSKGPKHCKPDYRRYQPDDLRALAEKAGLTVVDLGIDYVSLSEWDDCVLIARK